jgi:hypothetical protein
VVRTEEGIVDAFPGVLRGVGLEAWVAPSHERDWLTEKEANDLADLLARYGTQTLPSRLRRALWYHEYAARTYYSDLRWIFVCTALESLIHTDRHGSTQQFAVRVSALAKNVALDFSEEMGFTAYDLRSRLAHGQHFLSDLGSEDFRIYDTMEQILRSVLLKSITDSTFAAQFSRDKRIRDRWPLPIPKKKSK